MATTRRAGYFIVFVLLGLLTALEVWIAQLGLSRGALLWMLVGLAVAKALLVALFYMHLKDESRGLRWSLLVPLSIPVLLALVLAAETAWRLAPGRS
jgi:cytochrome c oxidase subunit 4